MSQVELSCYFFAHKVASFSRRYTVFVKIPVSGNKPVKLKGLISLLCGIMFYANVYSMNVSVFLTLTLGHSM